MTRVSNIERFIEGLEGERVFDSPTAASQQQVRDYGIARLPVKISSEIESSDSDVSVVEQSTTSSKETVSSQSVAKKCDADALFQSLCPSHSLLTDDVVNNQAFMSCVQSSQSSIMYYLKLRNQYHAQSRKRRKSSL